MDSILKYFEDIEKQNVIHNFLLSHHNFLKTIWKLKIKVHEYDISNEPMKYEDNPFNSELSGKKVLQFQYSRKQSKGISKTPVILLSYVLFQNWNHGRRNSQTGLNEE